MAEISRLCVVLCWRKYALKIVQIRNVSSTYQTERAMEDLRKNPYYEKYSKKISAYQNTSPEEFKLQLEEHHKQESRLKQWSGENRKFSSLSHAKKGIAGFLPPTFMKQKELNDVMKMELISDKQCSEIKEIWEEYHKHKEVIAAAIPSEMYDVIHSRSLQFPVFLFPIPRDKGYEFILCEFSDHEAHFTSLINYQAHKENAPECLTVTHYTDLKEKGLVLMRGEYNKEVLNGIEAKCLVNQLQIYYGQDNSRRLKLLQRFMYTPQDFKHMDLIAELECISV